MIAGFALTGPPADYGDLGFMTLIVNQQGRVYEKDLGPDTTPAMDVYDLDAAWSGHQVTRTGASRRPPLVG